MTIRGVVWGRFMEVQRLNGDPFGDFYGFLKVRNPKKGWFITEND